ncbi:galectin 17 isoform X2 [Sardina pilchardus]|uniref:galectin 17 isoform X2 n=1 Tax=Sardina pilchardus TaxID=27697 RepID=UPI002E136945
MDHSSNSTTSNLPLYLGIVLCVCSSLHGSIISTSCDVGQSAVLPCLISSLYQSPPSPYIQWLSTSETVFEGMGTEKYQGQGYEGRANVPQQMLEQGNCSLFLEDVRLTDSGVYESYLVVGKRKVKRKVLMQSVQFIVRDHKLKEMVEVGKDLLLELHTPQARQVVFQRQVSIPWEVLWKKGDGPQPTMLPRARENGLRIVIGNISWNDEGTYRVLDENGLALSTVLVTVTEPSPGKPESNLQKREFFEDHSAGSRFYPALPLLLR